MRPELEKASEKIKVCCTPTQKERYTAASNGNVSGWLKQMADERVADMLRQGAIKKPCKASK